MLIDYSYFFGVCVLASLLVYFVRSYYTVYAGPLIFAWPQGRIDKLIRSCPKILQGPVPPCWCIHSTLQLAYYLFVTYLHRHYWRPAYHTIQLVLDAPQCKGVSGRIQEYADEPVSHSKDCSENFEDDIFLDIHPPPGSDLPPDAPVIVHLPGMRGTGLDMPGVSIVHLAAKRGMRSVVMTRRGHQQPLKAPRFNMFGDVEDLHRVVAHVQKLFPNAKRMLVGYSCGSALCATYLGKGGKGFICAVGVCPGYDVSEKPISCCARVGEPYRSALVRFMKDHFVWRNEAVLKAYNAEAYEAACASKTVSEFVTSCAPFAGYKSSSDYYEDNNPVKWAVFNDHTPLMLINSVDDPISLVQNVYDHHEAVSSAKGGCLAIVLTHSGTHCPFLDGGPLGLGGVSVWTDAAILDYFEGALAKEA